MDIEVANPFITLSAYFTTTATICGARREKKNREKRVGKEKKRKTEKEGWKRRKKGNRERRVEKKKKGGKDGWEVGEGVREGTN